MHGEVQRDRLAGGNVERGKRRRDPDSAIRRAAIGLAVLRERHGRREPEQEHENNAHLSLLDRLVLRF